jgi:membrane-bound serine protease (ClpP class)
MKQKMENFATSYIAAIAEKRNRNVEWAESSVRESKAINAEKALELDVIDLVANDLPDLLEQIDGREWNGKTLKTAGATVTEIPMTLRERVFQMIWRPEVIYILMIIVIYGIIGELSSPGAILPGVVGAIALILLLYMAAVLPVNVAGLALIALAIALFLIDVFAPTHGVLTAGGVIAFFLGSLMMFDRSEGFYRLSLTLIIPATVVTALFFLFVAGAGWRAQRKPAQTGLEAMTGMGAVAVTPIDATGGKVILEGEYWNAVCDAPIAEGQPVEVVKVQGLTVQVKPKKS